MGGGGAGMYPSGMPTGMPADMPTGMPTGMPAEMPSNLPTDMPNNGNIGGGGDVAMRRKANGNTGGLFKGQLRKRVGHAPGSLSENDDETSSTSISFATMKGNYFHVGVSEVVGGDSTPSGMPSGMPSSMPSTMSANKMVSGPDGPGINLAGRDQGNSGGLLKGVVAKRTRKHSNHHRTASPASEEVEYEIPTGVPTSMPSQNFTVVNFDDNVDVDSGASNAGGSAGASSSAEPAKKKLGRNKHKHSPVATGTPSTMLKIEMISEDGLGWFNPNYKGLAFYISDESKTELLAYGTLEGGSYIGGCEFCFDAGSYYFRVSTPEAMNTKASWSFCNTMGGYGQQLAFHIEDGVCVPDALLDVDMICDATYSTVVTVQGTLTLTGVASEVMDSGSVWVLTTALSESVTGWDSSAIYISRTVLSAHPFELNYRALSSFTYDVKFEASFVSEMAYEIDGTSFFGVQGLVEELKDELSTAMSAGTFADTVRTLAISTGVTALDDVRGVALLDMSVEDILYVGTKDLVVVETEIEAQADSDTSAPVVIVDLFSSQEFISFVCMIAIGLVSFVGVITVSLKLKRASSATHDVINDDSLHSEQYMSNHVSAASRSPIRAGRL